MYAYIFVKLRIQFESRKVQENTLDPAKPQNKVSAKRIDLLKYLDIQVFCFDFCKTTLLSTHTVFNPSMIIMKGLIFITINILFLTLVSAYNDLSVSEVKELEVGYFPFV
mgnify:CR=1 FL=1